MRYSLVNRGPAPARVTVAAGGVCAAALLVTACGGGSGGSAYGGSTGGGGSTAAGGGASGPASAVIATASAPGATFLTDGGRAVYLWTKDSGGKSVCSGACTGAWPPVTTAGPATAAGGAMAGHLGTITRSDGTRQVTYNGHPLYFYVGDSGKGTASGQGSDQFGAKWWLVSPAGDGVTAAVTSFTAGGSGSSPAPSRPASSPANSGAGGGWG